ncbi:coiled-coil domain-containing protein [Herbiconiux ginsengi]|uniref:N-terminal domain of peptidoglycan hydrolase CwlO-containing protein n=1 Tax=Herbiconiux ginsengi TaxID=381665 RepID=A0A1H3QHF7_9MICO|nr:hypothetical protein [Herbiconiux ginsengi]SDZ12836.1 hypothetical protein SAMN05216554_2533 [Herbiconiux ginsengi]
MWKSPARALGVVAALVALVATPNLAASASPSASQGPGAWLPASVVTIDDTLPTWDEVNAAKANEQTKQAEIDKINSVVSNLEARVQELQNQAFQRGQEYLQASYDLQAAATYAETIDAQATAATDKASTAKTQVGQIAAQLYRAGGDSNLNLILNQNDADSLLYQLGTMSKLTEQTAGIRDAAVAAQNTADALTKQADVAKADRERLAQEANDRLAAAQQAQDDADAELAQQKQAQGQLDAQLASLKGTTAELEAGARARDQQIAEENARKAAAAIAAAEEGGGDPGSAWVPGDGSIMSPAEAQAYASSIMGSYGWDDAQFNCLVRLWIGESGWRANALNESSGAYGIPQSLPANKMASVADDYLTNAATQIIWGMNYIAGRYGTPCSALSTWTARDPHWY